MANATILPYTEDKPDKLGKLPVQPSGSTGAKPIGGIVASAIPDQSSPSQTPAPEPAAAPESGPTPTPAPATGARADAKAITTQVAETGETVESRLNALTAKGSKYTDLAKNEAMRSANTRGLINSTMAGAAGTEAAIRSALPIAQQDAKTMTDTRMANQMAQNEFLRNQQSAGLNIETAERSSELTREENTLLNDLTMKRDAGMSELSKEEQEQLTNLEMKRDAASSQLQINRDNNSAELNKGLAAFESELKKGEMELDSELKLRLEKTLQDGKFSDEAKMHALTAMSTLLRDAQAQIVEVGLSDRTAAQQAAAIAEIIATRDASLAVYEGLLADSDWDWGTDLTPEETAGQAAARKGTAADSAAKAGKTDPDNPPSGGPDLRPDEQKTGDNDIVSGDGKWRWDGGKGQWVPI